MYFLTSIIWKMTPFKSIMQYLEKMVPQQNMTAEAMQIRAKMERITLQVPPKCGISNIPYILSFQLHLKSQSSVENPSSCICDFPYYLLISKCLSK